MRSQSFAFGALAPADLGAADLGTHDLRHRRHPRRGLDPDGGGGAVRWWNRPEIGGGKEMKICTASRWSCRFREGRRAKEREGRANEALAVQIQINHRSAEQVSTSTNGQQVTLIGHLCSPGPTPTLPKPPWKGDLSSETGAGRGWFGSSDTIDRQCHENLLDHP